MKKHSETLVFKSINGTKLAAPIKVDIWTETGTKVYWAYIPVLIEEYLFDRSLIVKHKEKLGESEGIVEIIQSDKVGQIQIVLYRAYEKYYEANVKERKIIAYEFRYGLAPLQLRFYYKVFYHVSFPDGADRILTHSFKTFRNATTRKELSVREFEYEWVEWSRENEDFLIKFANDLVNGIDGLVKIFKK